MYLTHKMDLEVIAMKEYSTLSRSSELAPHHLIQFGVIPRTPHFGKLEGLTSLQGIQSAYSKPHRQDWKNFKILGSTKVGYHFKKWTTFEESSRLGLWNTLTASRQRGKITPP